MFEEFRELSYPPIDSKVPNMIKAQKHMQRIRGYVVYVQINATMNLRTYVASVVCNM